MMLFFYYTVFTIVVCGYVNVSVGSTGNEKCSDFDSCSASAVFRTCSCDEDCYRYGTCCKDSEKFSLMSSKAGEYKCYSNRAATPVYAKKTCSESYDGHDVHRALCTDNVDDPADILGTVLVTSVKSKKTYWNKNCAICNGEVLKNLNMWTVQVTCPSKHGKVKISRSTVESNLTYDTGASEWGLVVEDGFVACSIAFVQPHNAVGRLNYCAPNLIATCPSDTSDLDLVENCLMYHAERKQNSTDQYYRNVHCALCNGVPEDDLECPGRVYRTASFAKGKNIVRVSFSNGDWLDRSGQEKYKCSFGNMWDPFAQRCRIRPYEAPVLQPVSSAKEVIPPFHIFVLFAIVLATNMHFISIVDL